MSRRKIRTAEELEALPLGSVVLTVSGVAFQKQFKGEWFEASRWDGTNSSASLVQYGQVKLLHEGEDY
jgi:hypothetical protein